MEIHLAEHSGFCMGVRNAILRIVEELNFTREDICVYGPLIHNPQTIDVLDKRGLKKIDSLNNIKDRQIAVRTHGIPLTENIKIKKNASRVINLTCPRVARVQAIIRKYSNDGYFIIITGDKDHAEVIGLKSYASNGVYVISDEKDIKKIPKKEKYVLVSQTTLNRDLFNKIAETINKKYKKIVVIDTICDSTRNRQEDVISGIKSGMDTLVVVGGKNSANTNRLAQIGRDHNIKTIHIETEKELSGEYFSGSKKILVTAGASTPGWIINNVLEKLYNIKFRKSHIFLYSLKIISEFIVRSNILSSISAFFLSLIAQKYVWGDIDYRYSVIALLYIFSMYSINNYFDKDFLKINNPYKFTIYQKFGIYLTIISLISMAVSLTLSFYFNILTFALLLLFYIFGFSYLTVPVRNFVIKINKRFLKNIYNSKVITSFGWLIITAILPLFKHRIDILPLISVSIFIFIFIFLRHILLDITAFQGDLILGRATLPVMMGIKKSINFSYIFSLSGVILFSYLSYYTGKSLYIFFIANIFYYLIVLKAITGFKYHISLKYELIIDLNYLLLIGLYYLI